MSRWLKSVNNLLEQLDGQVENVAVDEDGLPTSRDAIDHILSRRGLHEGEDDDDEENSYEDDEEFYDDEDWEEEESEGNEDEEEEEIIDLEAPDTTDVMKPSHQPLFTDDLPTPLQEDNVAEVTKTTAPPAEETMISTTEPESATVEQHDVVATQRPSMISELTMEEHPTDALHRTADGTAREEMTKTNLLPDSTPEQSQAHEEEEEAANSLNDAKPSPSTGELSLPPGELPLLSGGAAAGNSNAQQQQQLKRSNRELKKAQNEARQLRKHVLSLHTQLETAEAEVKAQREELARAAERMERDRGRHNEEREELLDDHDEELDNQKDHFENLLKEQKERLENQIEELRERLKHVEERRIEEGGDWTKELEDAIQREREALKKLGAVQDQNSNLQSKVSKLETQQNSLQARLDSVTQNAQNAAEREREALDKLDASLSLHSRQLSQKQAREAELERTIADLGAALVVARQKEHSRAKQGSHPLDQSMEAEGTAARSLKEQLEIAVEELETVKAQLSLERQRSETLQHELQDMSKEQTEEASAAQARQRQHDRQVADLTSTISRLQASLRELKQVEGSGEVVDGATDGRVVRLSKEAEGLKKQVNSLSEQLIHHQELVKGSKTEILALKNRLQAATSRADNAEKALTASANAPNVYEMDVATSYGGAGRLRRRVKGGHRARAPKSGGTSVRSIRSALNMDPGRVGEGTEQVAATIDAIDSWMVDTGGMLRHEPLARLAFFLYLVILHLWAFCLVIFHAHTYEPEHADFGSLNQHGGLPNTQGEHHSFRQMEQMGQHGP